MMGYSTQVAVRFETGQTTVILVEALQSLGDPAVYLIQSYDDNMFALKIKLSSCSYILRRLDCCTSLWLGLQHPSLHRFQSVHSAAAGAKTPLQFG